MQSKSFKDTAYISTQDIDVKGRHFHEENQKTTSVGEGQRTQASQHLHPHFNQVGHRGRLPGDYISHPYTWNSPANTA